MHQSMCFFVIFYVMKNSFMCVRLTFVFYYRLRLLYFIIDNATCGKTTYVHCKAGRGRSTTIVLCYLVSSRSFWLKVSASVEALRHWLVAMWPTLVFQVEYKHMTPAAALEYVRSRRPRVLLAPSQWKV
jgi:atypical dual specificity phosphatase